MPIEFYFDFISPYAYLGSIGVERLAAKYHCEVLWRPMLLGVSVLKVMGLKGVPDTPLKSAYAAHDWLRFARLMEVPLAAHASIRMAPLPAMRAYTWLLDQDPGLAKRFAQAIYAAHWGEGRDMSDIEAVAATGATLGVRPQALMAASADEAVKARLRELVDASLARGVFGSPTFIVDGEMFWGADRLDQLDRWIQTGGW